jgi:hypothetical protein
LFNVNGFSFYGPTTKILCFRSAKFVAQPVRSVNCSQVARLHQKALNFCGSAGWSVSFKETFINCRVTPLAILFVIAVGGWVATGKTPGHQLAQTCVRIVIVFKEWSKILIKDKHF